MRKLLEIIKELNHNAENILITGLEGELLGKKLLISNGEIIFKDCDDISQDDLLQLVNEIKESEKDQKIETKAGKFFRERIGSEKKLVICGGGHVSIPVIKIAKMTGFHVTVIEDRILFANNARNAGADAVICEEFGKALDTIEGDLDTYFVIVTRGHRYDIVCLEKILTKASAYVGMIGSKVRVRGVKERVYETLCKHPKFKDGGEERLREAITHLYSPIGLDIKAETPEEIGVAIMAEIIRVKNEKYQSSGYTKEILKGALSEEAKDMGKVMATIIARKGSAPRGVGTKMLVLQDGTCIGTIGGGCAEADIRQKAILLMNEETPEQYLVDMTGREAEEDGMVCGGTIEVLLEPWR